MLVTVTTIIRYYLYSMIDDITNLNNMYCEIYDANDEMKKETIKQSKVLVRCLHLALMICSTHTIVILYSSLCILFDLSRSWCNY